MTQVDVLAIAAHPDDVELICGGTLIRAHMLGRKTGILDLAAGELASRGTPELRAKEAAKAAKVMGVSVRKNLGLPDGGITNTPTTRAMVAVVIRQLKPSVVITHSLHGRHPDHPIVAQLVRDACFVAGLKLVEQDIPPHRPRKVIHALSFREDNQKPTFVVDISEAFEKKLEAIGCYEVAIRRGGTGWRGVPERRAAARPDPASRGPLRLAHSLPLRRAVLHD